MLDHLQRLLEEAHESHRRGNHFRSRDCYIDALALIAGHGDLVSEAYLLSCIGGEHRDCDEYERAVRVLVDALRRVAQPDLDPEKAAPVGAGIKKMLAITFRDIYGPRDPRVLDLLEESRGDFARSGNIGSEANVMQHLAGCYIQLKRLGEASLVLQEALRKAEDANDVQLQGWIFDDMAEIEIEHNQFFDALRYTQTAREKVASVPDDEGEGDTWVTEARVHLRMGHLDQSLEAITHALDLYQRNKNLHRMIRARRHLAKAHMTLKHEAEARAALHEALQSAARLNLLHDQALVHLDLGELDLKVGEIDTAEQHAITSRGIADRNNIEDLVEQADDLTRRCRAQRLIGQ